MLECLILGDSIARGVAAHARECTRIAIVGISSDRDRVLKMQDEVWKDILLFQTSVNALLAMAQKHNMDRKTFALNTESTDQMVRSTAFKFFEKDAAPLDHIKDMVEKI